MNAEPKRVSNIKQLTSQECNNIEKGDIVIKEDSTGGHAYICTFKKDGVGMCLTYTDASCVETISYDYVDGAWVYNSMDLTHLQNYEHLSEDQTGVVIDGTLKVEEDIQVGNTTTAGQGQVTFKNPDLTNQGNWYITSPDQNSINIMQDTQNTGVKISRGTVYPLSDAYFTLGASSFRWKTLMLSHYVTWGNNVLIGKDSSNRFYVTGSDGNEKIKVGVNETYFANHVEPDSNNTYDLGRSGVAWRDLYVSRNVFLTGLPTSDPQVEGQLWNDNGVLKISAGE